MASPRLADRVKETSTTTGTGTFTLLGAVLGFQGFGIFTDGDTCPYVIVAVSASGVPTGQWETGIGTVGGSGTTLARTTPLHGSSGDTTLVSFSAGTKDVFNDRIADSGMDVQTETMTYQNIAHVTDAAVPYWGKVITIPAGKIVTGGVIVVTQVFNDSGIIPGDIPTIENYDNQVVYIFSPAAIDVGTVYDAHGLQTIPAAVVEDTGGQMVFGPSGGSIAFNSGATDIVGDGTTGSMTVHLFLASVP